MSYNTKWPNRDVSSRGFEVVGYPAILANGEVTAFPQVFDEFHRAGFSDFLAKVRD